VDLFSRSYAILIECPLSLFRARKRNGSALYDAPSQRAVARYQTPLWTNHLVDLIEDRATLDEVFTVVER
jgi:hypothetical protein